MPAWAWMAWGGALLAAMLLDRSTALAVVDLGTREPLKGELRWLADLLKRPGEWAWALVLAALATWAHPARWRGGALLAAAAALSSSSSLVKWAAGRYRPLTAPVEGDGIAPFHLEPFRGGLAGVFEQRNLAFPSGHASTAFAIAFAAAMLWPRLRWAFLALACVVALERVAENAHYLSDVAAGALLGAWCARGGAAAVRAIERRTARR